MYVPQMRLWCFSLISEMCLDVECPRNPKHWGIEYRNRKACTVAVGPRPMIQTKKNVHTEERHVKITPKKRKYSAEKPDSMVRI